MILDMTPLHRIQLLCFQGLSKAAEHLKCKVTWHEVILARRNEPDTVGVEAETGASSLLKSRFSHHVGCPGGGRPANGLLSHCCTAGLNYSQASNTPETDVIAGDKR